MTGGPFGTVLPASEPGAKVVIMGESEWPLVGRTGELWRLHDLVTDPQHPGMIIAGPSGVGKTRLAHEALNLAEERGLAILRVTATRTAAALPLGALAALLPANHHGETGGVDDRADLIRHSAAALMDRAGGQRLVLLVDDVQFLDDISAMLIQQLATAKAAFLLATLRSGEAVPEPIVALWKDGVVARLELDGLDVLAVEELLETVLGGPVDRATVAQLAVRCEGNVLFLRELVLGACHDGTLHDAGGIWRLVGPVRPSSRLVELVDCRLGRLEPAERRVLELLAYGEPLGRAELHRLTEPAVLQGLEGKGLLVSRTEGHRVHARLAHPVYGEVVRTWVSPLRLPEIAGSLAEAVEATGARRREDTLRVATWRLESGGARADLMLAAATTARWRYDFALAERLATAALEAGAGFDAGLLAAQLACLQGRPDEARQRLSRLAARATDDAQRGIVGISQLDTVAIYLGRTDEGLRLAEEMEAAITDPAWRDEITARRAVLVLGLHGPRAAAELAEPVVHRATGRALVLACAVGSWSFGRLGRIDAALETADRGYAHHRTLSIPTDWYPWIHLFERCEALACAGRFLEAEELANAEYNRALAEGSGEAQAFFSWHLASVVGERGHVVTAARHAREAIALYGALGRPQFVRECLTALTMALALTGQPAAAEQALAELDALALPPTLYRAVDLPRARAWVAIARGDVGQACALLREAAALAERSGDLVGTAAALHGLARLGQGPAVTASLDALAKTTEGTLTAVRAAHAGALVADDPSLLLKASGEFERMGADLLAAEASTDAVVAWRRKGDGRRAADAERVARTLADRCEGARTPTLRALTVPVRLTPAERQVAQLAVAGRSNKEIAAQLFLSQRTVANHLQHVYKKLGIRSRQQMIDTLDGAPG
jgi:DNA-binding CsgD family transcriptional regulator